MSQYESSLLPLENLSEMALYFLIVVFAIGGVVLVVLNIFNVRERKYEVGVLTAIGMKKFKVSLQFIFETLVVTFVFVVIGGCIGAVSSVPVTNSLLESQIEAAENVVLLMDISGTKEKVKKSKAYELLESVGLDKDEANRRILKLSGGQQQRVAIARALSYNPDIILADEPTGNLDGETQDEIMDIFRELAGQGKCVIIVTHSPEVAKRADQVYEIKK